MSKPDGRCLTPSTSRLRRKNTVNIYSLSTLRHPVETDRVSSGFFSSILFATSPSYAPGEEPNH